LPRPSIKSAKKIAQAPRCCRWNCPGNNDSTGGRRRFYTTLSFRDANSRLMEYKPKKVFNHLFGENTPQGTR
jgi:hypothetical protein